MILPLCLQRCWASSGSGSACTPRWWPWSTSSSGSRWILASDWSTHSNTDLWLVHTLEYWSLIGQHNKILIYDLSTHSNTDLWSTTSQHWSMTGPHIAILNTDLWLVHKPRYWPLIGWCCSPGPGASPWWPASCSRSPSTSSSTSAWPISASTLGSSTSSQARTMLQWNTGIFTLYFDFELTCRRC